MYYFIKMSSGWYGSPFDSVNYEAEKLQAHLDNGDVVVMCDDIGSFCDMMGVEELDIQMAK